MNRLPYTVRLDTARASGEAAAFRAFGDANLWAMQLAAQCTTACKVIVAYESKRCAVYTGDGKGEVRSAADEIGGAL